MAESFPNGQKTLWEKDKLLVTSNLSFSRSVFKRLMLQTRKKQGLFWKGLTHYRNDKFLDWSKFAFADDKISVIKKSKFSLGRVENIV